MVSHVALVCTPLMTLDVEQIVLYLLAIHTSSLVKYLFSLFVHFLIGLFYLLLNYKSSLCILDINGGGEIGYSHENYFDTYLIAYPNN